MPRTEDIPTCPDFAKITPFGCEYRLTPSFRRDMAVRELTDWLCERRGLGLFPESEAESAVGEALDSVVTAASHCEVRTYIATEDGEELPRWGRHLRPYSPAGIDAWLGKCLRDYPEDEADLRAYAAFWRRYFEVQAHLAAVRLAAAALGEIAHAAIRREVEEELDLHLREAGYGE